MVFSDTESVLNIVNEQGRWCNGNIAASKAVAGGSIPPRPLHFTFPQHFT